jgi:hypothetical protein
VELRTGRENDGGLLVGKMNRRQHLLILYDIYCLMLLEWRGLQVRPHVRSEKVVKGSPRGVNLVSAPSA